MSDLSGFIFIEAKPKFRQHNQVLRGMLGISALCNELFANGSLGQFSIKHDNLLAKRKLSVQIIFDELVDRDKLQENRRFQELMIDIRLASKRDRFRRFKHLRMTRYKLVKSTNNNTL